RQHGPLALFSATRVYPVPTHYYHCRGKTRSGGHGDGAGARGPGCWTIRGADTRSWSGSAATSMLTSATGLTGRPQQPGYGRPNEREGLMTVKRSVPFL